MACLYAVNVSCIVSRVSSPLLFLNCYAYVPTVYYTSFCKNTQVRIRIQVKFYMLTYKVTIMGVKQAVVVRFHEIMLQRGIRPNELANLSGITPSTVYSMLDDRRKEITINLIKKLCDGLEITLGEFFNSTLFDTLEQEVR